MLKQITDAMKIKDFFFFIGRKAMRQHIKNWRHYFANKGPYSKSYGFSSSFRTDVRVGPKAES